ncbi:spore coat protein SA [Methylomusa anaerophila]|uniref:Spore coat protein SA n=1 Tax=Methylomusa anaerophila TaxID=1930071 RepID=A0A348ALJ3_9FIRM|nr:spore coat protein SA [Methylomusa anaerophila]
MRVVHIDFSDSQSGGTGIARTLMEAMTALGHDTALFSQHSRPGDPRFIPVSGLQSGWRQQLLAEEKRKGLFDLYSAAVLDILEHPSFAQADIVHLHSVNAGFSFLLLPFLTAKTMVWSLQDTYAFTAGCYHTDYCDYWRQGWCTHCPEGDKGEGSKACKLVQYLKGFSFQLSDFTIVCPTKWLKDQVAASILQEHDIRLIRNGVDGKAFQPGDRAFFRTQLGLPLDRPVLLCDCHGITDWVREAYWANTALRKVCAAFPDLVLLNLGGTDHSTNSTNSSLAGLPVSHIDIPVAVDRRQLAAHYGAADVFLALNRRQNATLAVCEAMACGTPVVALAAGGMAELVVHGETGYLAQLGDSKQLAEGINCFLGNAARRQQAGTAARKKAVEAFGAGTMVDGYLALYEELGRKPPPSVGRPDGKKKAPAVSAGEEYDFHQIAAMIAEQGWGCVWQEFGRQYNSYKGQSATQRAIFTDKFFRHCLLLLKDVGNPVFWDIMEKWYGYRKMPLRNGNLPDDEYQALLEFCRSLREKLRQYFERTSVEHVTQLTEEQQWLLITLWRSVFLNPFAPQNLEAENNQEKEEDGDRGYHLANWYPGLLVTSLYQPFAGGTAALKAGDVWNASFLPFFAKMVFTFWMINTPYFSGRETQRQKFLTCATDLCREALNHVQHRLPSVFVALVQEFVANYWSISYLGGNNIQSLSAFGDLISTHMQHYFPRYAALNFSDRKPGAGRKIRVGYISRNFYSQAVSYYMVNRLIHHDKNRFEVYTFALGDTHDEISELFVKHSDRFQRFNNLYDVPAIAQSITDSELDILIYTDIGMDPATYMLAGLQLAPVQCALVGHGTTTGLPTIQYYISGDFEPADAAAHYREKLVRLPNLGAAQYPPPFGRQKILSRQAWNIPADMVVFVSCANGIKHVAGRDYIFAEILKQADNAWIILKPCHSANVDQRLVRRIMNAAKEAGVDNRLFVVPPLPFVSSLLAVADIQLDTYPYGGWTTNMEALYVGLPVVTQEGDMARSRWGAYMLRALGINEGIAANEGEYIQWAVRFAQNAQLRRSVKQRIKERARDVLFNGSAAQAAYEEALAQMIEQ